MNPGKLDRRITLQSLEVARGNAGGVSESWTEVDTVWAEKVEQSTREFRSAVALRSEVNRMFRIRYRTDITAKHRVLFDGRIHEIVGDPTEENFKEFLLLACNYTEGRT